MVPWLIACDDVRLNILIYCTFRSKAEQDELYARGRTKPGKIVTYAKAGESAHQFGLALDFVPMIEGGKPQWTAPSPLWNRAISLAEKYGLESASKWPKFKEWPHVQFPSWKTYATEYPP